MTTRRYVLALDQGTTGSTALVVDPDGRVRARGYAELPQYFPRPGWVEHDPEEIWATVERAARVALAEARIVGAEVAAIGIANQRETTIVWDRASGAPIHRAIVWQCRRTAPTCDRLRAEDAWLLWKLTGGSVHGTDASNASRTLCLNLKTGDWDDEPLKLLGVPRAVLPVVLPSAGALAETPELGWLPRGVRIAGIAGDQQAALFGQACHAPGAAKNTYGTGCFMLLNTGLAPVVSSRGLLTTIAWRIDGHTTYALEGSVFIAGAAIQWLRDGLGLLAHAAESETMARSVPDTAGVYFVPAFVGLGAPYWDMYARGTIVGLTRGTTGAHLARAALEAIAFQSRDVLEAMAADRGIAVRELRVDGGASANDFLCQFQADIMNVAVLRPSVIETTSLGAAYLAGLGAGLWRSFDDLGRRWAIERTFTPALDAVSRAARCQGWRRAVERARGWAGEESR